MKSFFRIEMSEASNMNTVWILEQNKKLNNSKAIGDAEIVKEALKRKDVLRIKVGYTKKNKIINYRNAIV